MESRKTEKKLKPTSNEIQISSKRDPGFYIFLSKLFLMDFNDIELHALGDAIGIAVKVGELLCRSGYTTMGQIQTTTIAPEDEKTEGNRPPIRRGKKAKLIVKLTRSSEFPELIKNFKITRGE